MNIVQEGEPAPDFSLILDSGATFTLSQQRGKPVLLYFYPEDDSGSCTKQNQEFSALADEFTNRGAMLVGISPDSVEKHRKFRGKYDLAAPLAADPDLLAIKAFGLWQPKKLYGREYEGLIRTSILIGRDGAIVRIVKATRVAGHAQKMLDALDAYLAP